ncbi:hypothetical protein [Streptomyces sp. NPDC060035]|uniref:hypothetical protein n=1 Tax=Streptomyces sp. NPDC060035 TaxID=3347044 RepID=UPI0036D1F5AA
MADTNVDDTDRQVRWRLGASTGAVLFGLTSDANPAEPVAECMAEDPDVDLSSGSSELSEA